MYGGYALEVSIFNGLRSCGRARLAALRNTKAPRWLSEGLTWLGQYAAGPCAATVVANIQLPINCNVPLERAATEGCGHEQHGMQGTQLL